MRDFRLRLKPGDFQDEEQAEATALIEGPTDTFSTGYERESAPG